MIEKKSPDTIAQLRVVHEGEWHEDERIRTAALCTTNRQPNHRSDGKKKKGDVARLAAQLVGHE